ncbi:hypothetical protein CA13_70680 [Planctomycetes bacterium CA13]|uniref:Uncharacterized protein n=2 Tax=Novipirellula herctigrandis TaxID=2527986 RepID=A0A5C5YP13_9BACT|nr:hypothetical protein CA13_70680 [Planctomycetes bacterium CA13]
MLSAYMDDALSTDERTRVEQLLRDDPVVAKQLSEMKRVRQTLKKIDHQNGQFRLSNRFAQSVIEATIARGRTEGLSDDHCVMKLAEQPSPMVTVGPSREQLLRQRSFWKVVASIGALAASVAIAFVAMRGQEEANQPVALVDPTTEPTPREDFAAVDPVGITGDNISEQAMPDLSRGSLPSSESPQVASTANDPSSIEPVRDPAIASNMEIESKPLIASAEVPDRVDVPDLPNRKIAVQPVVAIQAILVLDVRQTMDGRNSNAVETAMEQGKIDLASRKEIDENVVRFARKEASADESDVTSATVLYLEAPAKKLDQFILNLIADEQGIESVGMSIATDTPLMGIVNSFAAVDPTTVKHEETSWQLATGQLASAQDSGGPGIEALVNHLRDREFARLDRESAGLGVTSAMASPSRSESTDVIARVLVVVH